MLILLRVPARSRKMTDSLEKKVPRRLAAILAADIAGYSRLMGEDEQATVQALKGHQSVVLPLVSRYGGHVIDTAGDGILAEFPSVINATECAVEIQKVVIRQFFAVQLFCANKRTGRRIWGGV